MNDTPRANRLHIGLFGRRNAGKSSIINLLTDQQTALVSDTPGTTADPVLKSMEVPPIGPVVFIDTAGLDDEGPLGEMRVARSKEMMQRTDIALLVVPAMNVLHLQQEKNWIEELKKAKVPILGVLNKIDLLTNPDIFLQNLQHHLNIPFVSISTQFQEYRAALLKAIIHEAPLDFERPTIVGDLIQRGDSVVLVTPQDLQAPKGRLILPQVQVIRDVLDHGGMPMMVKDNEAPSLLQALRHAPSLVITDSQVFPKVCDLLDTSVRLTSFSILMARYKGDLHTLLQGAQAVKYLRDGDKVLIAEACTHHALDDDIGRKKIPRWLRDHVGSNLRIDIATGNDFPANLREYALVIHCGACMFSRKQLMGRLLQANAAGVPVTNYGILIAALNNMLDRVTCVFPEIQK